MKLSLTGQEKGDLLIQVTAWAGLTTYHISKAKYNLKRTKCCKILYK
jgi:hypothetical protein